MVMMVVIIKFKAGEVTHDHACHQVRDLFRYSAPV